MSFFGDKLIFNIFTKPYNIINNINRRRNINSRQSLTSEHNTFEPKTLLDISKNVTDSEYNAEDYLFLKYGIIVMKSIDEKNEQETK